MAIVVWLIVAEALYVRALRVLGGRGVRVPRGQIVVLAPRAWPAGGRASSRRSGSLADELLSAHMAEHLLMADLGAPLLLAGLRNPVLAFFLPRAVLVPLARRRRLREAFRYAAPAARGDSRLHDGALRLAPLVRLRGRRAPRLRPRSPSTRASSSPGCSCGGPALEPKRRRLHGDLWKIGHIFAARMLGMFLGMSFVLIREPVYTGVYGSGERRGMTRSPTSRRRAR